MALIKCTECGKEISDKAEKCVHCGCPIEVIKKELDSEKKEEKKETIKENKTEKKDSHANRFIIVLIILSLIVLGIMFGAKKDSHTNQSNERNNQLIQLKVITEYINIRSEKDINSKIIGKVHKGEIYTIISMEKESKYHWLEIETNNHIHGYISGKEEYVEILERDIPEEEKIEKKQEANENSNSSSTPKSNKTQKPSSSVTPKPSSTTPAPSSSAPAPSSSTATPQGYTITSIEGIGGSYRTIGYTTICSVDSFTASTSAPDYSSYVTINYSFKTTMTKRGNLSYCQFRIKIYDENNMVVASTVGNSPQMNEGESSLNSDSYLIKKDATSSKRFHIKLEDK